MLIETLVNVRFFTNTDFPNDLRHRASFKEYTQSQEIKSKVCELVPIILEVLNRFVYISFFSEPQVCSSGDFEALCKCSLFSILKSFQLESLERTF
jgi:hypothetical protein